MTFMEFLGEKKCWEATQEILASSQMMADIKEADRAWKAGRKEEFFPL